MELHFDPHQQYQLDAINAVIGVFEGQPLNQGDFSFTIDNQDYWFQEGGVGAAYGTGIDILIDCKNELLINDSYNS